MQVALHFRRDLCHGEEDLELVKDGGPLACAVVRPRQGPGRPEGDKSEQQRVCTAALSEAEATPVEEDLGR